MSLPDRKPVRVARVTAGNPDISAIMNSSIPADRISGNLNVRAPSDQGEEKRDPEFVTRRHQKSLTFCKLLKSVRLLWVAAEQMATPADEVHGPDSRLTEIPIHPF
ncbi:hypothetical protein GH722_15675 [Alphaproteobacteria bacterium HT1-32]|nr:hypothetical protein [Alphaproteobacteria bacterium HT1-32]